MISFDVEHIVKSRLAEVMGGKSGRYVGRGLLKSWRSP